MEAILYIGIAQTFFAGILIALKKPKIYANQILSAWLFIICAEMIIVLINETLSEIVVGQARSVGLALIISIYRNRQTVAAEDINLLNTLANQKIFIASACGGKGSCGYCKVKILDGGGDILPTELPRESSSAFSAFLKPFIGDVARADYGVAFNDLEMPEAFKRAVIVLRYYLDYSEAEMAALLDKPSGTIKSRLHTARRRLGGLLRQVWPVEPRPVKTDALTIGKEQRS